MADLCRNRRTGIFSQPGGRSFPNESLTFSASRDKIVAGGRLWVWSLISHIIESSLMKQAIFERLAPETKTELERTFLRCEAAKFDTENAGLKTTKELDSSTIDLIEGHLPKTEWPPGMHQKLAVKLDLPPGVVYRAVSALITTGRIKKPSFTNAPIRPMESAK